MTLLVLKEFTAWQYCECRKLRGDLSVSRTFIAMLKFRELTRRDALNSENVWSNHRGNKSTAEYRAWFVFRQGLGSALFDQLKRITHVYS